MRESKKRWIFLIVYLAYTSIYVARVNLSMAGPEMIDIGILDTVQLGLLGSAFSTIYAFGRFLNGGLSDRTPPWLMITAGLTAAGIANLCIGFFPPFIGIFLLWSVNAYAQSMLWSSVLCLLSSMHGPEEAKKKTSLMVTSVATGNIVAILLNTWLITTFGVSFAFVVPGAFTLVLGGLVFLTTRKIAPPAVEKGNHISMWQLLKNKEICLMGVPAVCHGVMKENISLWMAVYLIDVFGVDLSTSAYFVLFIPLLAFIGRFLYPVCYKACKDKEHVVSILGFLACAIFALPVCFGGISPTVAVICLSVIYAAASMVNTSILSIYPIHFLKTGNVASVSGMMDFATYLGGGISSVLYGVLIRSFGYLPMFLSWIVISVLSIVFLRIIMKKSS